VLCSQDTWIEVETAVNVPLARAKILVIWSFDPRHVVALLAEYENMNMPLDSPARVLQLLVCNRIRCTKALVPVDFCMCMGLLLDSTHRIRLYM
jgi:hypothetical protein